MAISFKASQSFVLRDGWVQKSFIEMREHPGINVFSKKDGVIYLGVGSNMVTSIKYWLDSAEIIQPGAKKIPELSELGALIERYDPFLESTLSWNLIHMKLARNYESTPLFWILFNYLDAAESFTKESFVEDAIKYLESKGESPNQQYIEDDFGVLVRSYISTGKSDPEDNMDCPLSSLGLLKQTGRGQYRKTQISLENLDIRVVYYLVKSLIGKKDSATFDDIVSMPEGPCKIFNLDRTTLMSVFMLLDNAGLVKVTRTAGLNTVYFNKKTYKLKDLFEDVLGGSDK